MRKKKYLIFIIVIGVILVFISLSMIFLIFHNRRDTHGSIINPDFISDLKLDKAEILKVLPGEDFLLHYEYICIGRLTDNPEVNGVYIERNETGRIVNEWKENIKDVQNSLPIYKAVSTKEEFLEIKKMDKKCSFFELKYDKENLIVEIIELKEITDKALGDDIEEMEIYYRFLKWCEVIE